MLTGKHIEAIYPLSPAQQGILFHSIQNPGANYYFTQFIYTLQGDLHLDSFKRAWRTVVSRHAVLRTAFAWKNLGRPLQVVFHACEIDVLHEDWRYVPEDEQAARLQDYLESDRTRIIDLNRAPLFRLALFRCSEDKYEFVWTNHHALLDGWSNLLVLKEVQAFYSAFRRNQSLEPRQPRPYQDYIQWLSKQEQGPVESYWRKALNGVAVPTALPRNQYIEDAEEESVSHRTFSRQESAQLQRTARHHRLTLNTLVQGAWALLLGRYSGECEVVFGNTFSGRLPRLTGSENMVGMFVSTLPVRVNLAEPGLAIDWLKRLQDQQACAREFSCASLVDIHAWSGADRGQPLFDSVVAFENFATDVFETAQKTQASGLFDFQLLSSRAVLKTNNALSLVVAPDRHLGVQLYYKHSWFTKGMADQIIGHFVHLLRELAANLERPIDQISMLTPDEAQQLRRRNTPDIVDPSECIHERFEAVAQRVAANVAVKCGNRQLTYGELNKRSNQLAHYLRSLGVKAESKVGICVDRNLELVVGLLAILKAGATYVPLDPGYPIERLEYMSRDSGITVLLTEDSLKSRFPSYCGVTVCLDTCWAHISQMSCENLSVNTTTANLAYVIYTSGSTGRPKGVMITHANAVRLLERTHQWFNFDGQDVWTLFHSYAFDFSVWELWGCLLSGGRVVVVPYWISRAPEKFLELLKQESVTVLNQTPSAFLQLMHADEESTEPIQSLRFIIFGGEALDFARIGPWVRRYGTEHPRLVNMYGITETTVHVTYRPVQEADVMPAARSYIGIRIPDLTVYVCDRNMNPLPSGAIGELYVGGAGLARGYLNMPGLTAEKFVPDTFGNIAAARLYRSGDLACWTEEGDLAFFGRRDHQVKIRGFRIELGEIEAALAEHPAVKEALVMAEDGEGSAGRLVAFVVPANVQDDAAVPHGERQSRGIDFQELRTFLAVRLPEYMVPGAFAEIPEVPLTVNGKLDRKRLPVPGQVRPSTLRPRPQSAEEEILCGIFAEVLAQPEVNVADNFFDLGGHSLLATRVTTSIRQCLGVELPVRALFETPTVAGMAGQVKAARGRQQRMAPAIAPVAPPEVEKGLQLSYAQQRLWFIEQMEPGSAVYNIPVGVRLKGELNREGLVKSLQEIVRRHQVLRTVFPMEGGEARQHVLEDWQLGVEEVEIGSEGISREEAEARLQKMARDEAGQGFDLEQGPLVRARLVRMGEQDHVLLVTMHHIVSDGWSMAVMGEELVRLYQAYAEGKESPLEELPVQYGDYAQWQREWLQGEVLEEQIGYWKRQLAGVEALELPTDYVRGAEVSRRGGRVELRLGTEATEKLKGLSRRAGVTLFMSVVAGLEVVLWRYSGQEEMTVGTVIANRNRKEVEKLIGFFANTLVLRGRVRREETVGEKLREVRRVALEAYEHQDVPFEKVVAELEVERDLSRTPLFQVMVVLQNVEEQRGGWGGMKGLEVEGYGVEEEWTKFEMVVALAESEEGLRGTLTYARELYDEGTMERLARQLETVLGEMGEGGEEEKAVGELGLLSGAERDKVLREWNRTEQDYPDTQCVHQLFELQARKMAGATAVIFENTSLSYDELNRLANRFARYLRTAGVKREDRVALCLDRSEKMIVALLGILKAGAAYVAIEPSYPTGRIALMLADTRPVLLLTNDAFEHDLPPDLTLKTVCLSQDWPKLAGHDDQDLNEPCSPDQLAYISYTSGSTGIPKGVSIPHRGIIRLASASNYASMSSRETFLQFAPVGFDASTFEIWCSLLNGARLVVMPGNGNALDEIGHVIEDKGVTTLWLTAAMFHWMVDNQLSALMGLHQLLAGGDVLSVSHVKTVLAAAGESFRLIDGYGPTENTTFTCCHRLNKGEEVGLSIPIGVPISNTQVYVLDDDMNALPVGVPGELYAGGEGLARGYWMSPAETAAKFVPHPFASKPGARLYKTGDLVQWRGNGSLRFMGRRDSQVKIRGFRVEPGEIEAVLRLHPEIHEAVVLITHDDALEKKLTAYIVLRDKQNKTVIGELRQYMKKALPEYMAPAAYVELGEMPLNSSGKVDRKQLPEPVFARAGDYVPPQTPEQQVMCSIWSEVLGVPQVGIEDSFFELGGHSLLATQVISRICGLLNVNLSISQFFESPTVGRLVEKVNSLRDAQNREDPRSAPDSNLEQMLAGLQQLSDEEVQVLLATTTPGS